MSKEELTEEVKRIEMLESQSRELFKNGDYEKAYEINKKLADEFPQSYDYRSKCMNNLFTFRRFDEAKTLYFNILEDMKERGCGWKLFESVTTQTSLIK